MSIDKSQREDLVQLLEALCEDRLGRDGAARLEELVLADAAARQFYLDYVDLHGTLYWDTARGVDDSGLIEVADEPRVAGAGGLSGTSSRRWGLRVVTLATAVLVAVGLAWQPWRTSSTPGIVSPDRPPQPIAGTGTGTEVVAATADPVRSVDTRPARIQADPARPLANKASRPTVAEPLPAATIVEKGTAGSFEAIVGFVDEQLAASWQDNEITASPVASDSEWLRRVYLDIVGHIPPSEDVVAFLKDRRPGKRAEVIDRLLDDPDYIRHSTTTWANLLVGRVEQPGVDRPMLEKFLRGCFARNRPWNQVVSALVDAEGRNDRDGATNFLLAHLNNDAAPATAITMRLFLGTQVQCTQCHNHPFNTWKQQQFHDLNVFFKTTRSRPVRGSDAVELVSVPSTDGSYYEDRQGILHLALPRYRGEPVEQSELKNLRHELARRMTDGRDSRLARALINRIWARFFGHGFTSPVDDMGPHNPPTHPAVLDRLASEFTAGGFDLKRLIRWVCNTRAYGLTSRMGETNGIDDPSSGQPPLFSRAYVKPMSVEQLYDSLLVATQADRVTASDWESVASNRSRWLTQFVHPFGTDENDETMTFDGSITQALVMMNGDLIREALQLQPGSYLHGVLVGSDSDSDKVKRLCLAALGRFPTSLEMRAIRGMLPLRSPSQSRNSPTPGPLVEGLQDVFWAYLNSNEFITVP